MQLILVRYGDYTDRHLNKKGEKQMTLASERLKSLIPNKKVIIICANTPRVIESAKVIEKYLQLSPTQALSKLYAAIEDDIKVDIEKANQTINLL